MNSPVTAQKASKAENVSIWWRHHAVLPSIGALWPVQHYWPVATGIHQRPVVSLHTRLVMQSLDNFVVGRLNKLMNKQSICRWFETQWSPYNITLKKIHNFAPGSANTNLVRNNKPHYLWFGTHSWHDSSSSYPFAQKPMGNVAVDFRCVILKLILGIDI